MDYEISENSIRIRLDSVNYADVKFHVEDSVIYIDSTYTPEQYRGRGIGGDLMKAVIRYAKEKRLSIVPLCSFAVEYFKKNPSYD